MVHLEHLIYREIPLVEKIIRDEVWLEGERRGVAVTADDPVVRERVCDVVLRVAHEWQQMVLAQLSAEPGPSRVDLTRTDKAA